ncbi:MULTISPECIES: YaeQ family protein [Dyella]|uniref:YaeQ family protein n=2 Tax=Dyella TaxID=231454 RepID=A0A4R0Z140_9GAMM|nr:MULTISPECIES: YaeQ family protein [Dyella]TBR38930.1 YaeQ family protein [Dyella terrae]TCI13479.1 YaeQ family protein [Dyella soli]
MALTATIHKAELQISDLDRHYYATHALTLARHPSETEERLMVRLVAFALFADDRLEFGKGLSTDDEPDLWRRDYSGDIEQWIDLGQPDESRVRKACARARDVVVINYGGRGADVWWDKCGRTLARHDNLTVINIDESTVSSLVALLARGMRLQCLIQDGHLQLMDERTHVSVEPTHRMRVAA